MYGWMNCTACSAFKMVLVGWRKEDLISVTYCSAVICRMSESIDRNDHILRQFGPFYMYNHLLKENARLCLRFFRHHLVNFGFPGPKTTALTEQKRATKSLPILTPGDPKLILQIRWGMHTNRGWQSLLSHWSLAWGCVNTVNFYKVSLCVLCRDFNIIFFSAWVP